MLTPSRRSFFFFFNDTATTEIYTLSLHDALPIYLVVRRFMAVFFPSAEHQVTTRISKVEQHSFKTEGKILVKPGWLAIYRSEEHTSELQSHSDLVCRLLLEKKNKTLCLYALCHTT